MSKGGCPTFAPGEPGTRNASLRSIFGQWPVYIHVGSKLVLQESNTGRSEIRGERNG